VHHFHTGKRCVVEWESSIFEAHTAPWTDNRSHPQIVNRLAVGNQYSINLRELLFFDSAERGPLRRVVEDLSRRRCQLQCGRHRANSLNLNQVILDGIKDLKKESKLGEGSQNYKSIQVTNHQ
jgi:hypothetical protein